MKKNSTISALFALLTTCAWAQEQDSVKVNPLKEVVISDTKFAQRKEKSGKIIEVISAKDLAQKPVKAWPLFCRKLPVWKSTVTNRPTVKT